MKEIICEICKEKKENFCKNRCPSCYHRIWWREWKEKLKKEDKYEEQKLHTKKLAQKRKGKDVEVVPKKAKNGSGTITQRGYKRLSKIGHPNAQKGRWVLEHVYVMSEYLGRPIRKGETVHHKNGNRLDNRIENLELWSTVHGAGQRVEDILVWCEEFIKKYKSEFSDKGKNICIKKKV